MQFLVPNFLWALSTLLIPIIIHFFHFRRTKKVYFSQVAFLRTIDTQTSSFRTLKQWLTLLLRLLALACIVLAFAQPFWKNSGEGAVGESSAFGIQSIYLDNSRSMENLVDNKGLLDQAIIQLEEWLSTADVSSSWQWMTNDRMVGATSPISPKQVKKELTEVRFSGETKTLMQIMNKQVAAADNVEKGGKRRYFYFSDFQKSTLGSFTSLPIDSLDEYHFIPILPEKTTNIIIDSVWLENPFLREMTSSVLRVKVRNEGNEPLEEIVLRFLIDNQPISTATVNIPAKGQATASFSFTIRDKGEHEGQLNIEDQPVTFDNTYHFVLVASPQVNVVHLFHESPSKFVSEVFQDDSFVTYSAANARNVNLGSLLRMNLIVLDGLTSFPSGLREAINQIVQKGGTVLFIPPSGSFSLEEYRSFLGTFGIQALELSTATAKVPLAEPNVSNPFFKDVFDKNTPVEKGKMQVPEVQTKLSWRGAGEVIWQQQTGERFLTRTKQSSGGWAYILAAPMDKQYGTFVEHAFFVATFIKMAALSMAQPEMAYRLSQEQTIRIPYNAPTANAVLSLKKGTISFVPSQSIQGNEWVVQVPSSSEIPNSQGVESGIYEVYSEGKYVKKIALNHETKESLLAHYSVDELRSMTQKWPNIIVHEGITAAAIPDLFDAAEKITPLWWYFALAALVFLIVETLVLRFWKK